jgi:hypothetical protein
MVWDIRTPFGLVDGEKRAVHADSQTGRHEDQRIADESRKAMTEAMASLHFGSLASAMRVHRGREIRE